MATGWTTGWTWPGGEARRYCVKVTVATGAGYLLAIGGADHAVYGAFSAALIVGASRGEDIGSASNRVRGSVAGMLAALALALSPLPPALAVAIAVGATAFLCMGAGWGIPAARVGASLCAVMVLMHGGDVIEYSAMRIANTLIGIGAGLVVSYAVLPVRGRDAVERDSRKALDAVAALLDAFTRGDPVPTARFQAAIEGMHALEKTMHDADREFGSDPLALRPHARQVEIACLGVLMAGVGHAELRARPEGMSAIDELQRRAAELAGRAREAKVDWTHPPTAGSTAAYAEGRSTFEQGLRKVEEALRALGR